MKKWLYLLLLSDYFCIIIGVLIIYVLGYAEIYLGVSLGVVAVVTGLCVYNTNEFRYSLAPTKKAIIYADIINYKLLTLYYGKRKARKIGRLVNDALFFNLRRGCISIKGTNQYSILFEYKNRNEIINYINKVSDEVYYLINDGVFNVSLKFGVQICTEDDYETNENKAEIACVNARVESASIYSFFDEADADKILEEKRTLDMLLNALRNDEFEVYYQPQYNFKTKRIVGSEALIRLKHDGEVISSSEFIDVAEKYNFVVLLDEYVLKEVCKRIGELKRSKIDFNHISINISRKTICERDMMVYYSSLLDRYKIKRNEIELEITERDTDEDNNLNKLIHKLSKRFNVCIDDFGVGSSTISMLTENNIRAVKVDKSFIQNESTTGKKILSSIINLVNELDFDLIVEGVETEKQARYLKTKNCDIIQGDYFSKPLNYEEFVNLLKEKKN